MTVLTTYSDALFVIWFAAPACLAFLITQTTMTRKRKFLAFSFLGALTIGVTIVDKFFRVRASPIPMDHLESIKTWVDILVTCLKTRQWAFWLSAALSVVMLGRGVLLVFAQRDPEHQRRDSIELAVVFCNSSAFLLPFVSGSLTYLGNLRYALPMLILPYVWVLLVASRIKVRRWPKLMPAVAVLFWIWAIVQTPRGLRAVQGIEDQKTLGHFLVEQGLKTGFGDYWTCKRAMFETDYAVHIMQLNQFGERNDFAFNKTWYERRRRRRARRTDVHRDDAFGTGENPRAIRRTG
ncbi:MAG: hypothetical protein QM811_08285 [Pirellulales bacterium]